jgi:ketosteroid isomerase-like protein
VDPTEPTAVARHVLKAFSAADFERMRALLAEDLVARITNAEGGMDRVQAPGGLPGAHPGNGPPICLSSV